MALQFDKIGRDSVVNHVVNQITALIANKEFKPGDQIPTETELAEYLGVSRNSIREAVKILKAIGLLEIKRGKGTFVATCMSQNFFDPLIFSLILEPKSNKDLYEFRIMFDSMVLINIIDKISEDDIKALRQIIEITKENYNKFEEIVDYEYFIQQDICFHRKLLKISKNPIIERIGNSMLELLPEYIKRSIVQKNGIIQSIHNHEEIVQVLEDKKKDKIVDIIEKTLIDWKQDWNGNYVSY